MTYDLMPYQQEVIAWAENKKHAYFALEQGLGKTIVASSEIKQDENTLIIAPASLLIMWQRVISSFGISLASIQIASYNKIPVIPNQGRIIFDEAHYLKNPSTKRTKQAKELLESNPRATVRYLSGTPILNRPIELWPILNMSKVTSLSWFSFGRKFCNGYQSPWGWDFSGASNQESLKNGLQCFMIRKTKKEVMKDLPQKTYRVIELDLPLDRREKAFDADDIVRNPHNVAFTSMSEILHMNAVRKLDMSVKYIKDLLEEDPSRKIVVFAHHRDILEELDVRLKDYNPVSFTGGMTPKQKDESVQKFQNDPYCRLFIGSIQAAGVGITLTESSHIVFVESSWTPSQIEQCADRCHRIGQKNNVLVDILTIHQSIDAQVLHSVLRKKGVIEDIMGVA